MMPHIVPSNAREQELPMHAKHTCMAYTHLSVHISSTCRFPAEPQPAPTKERRIHQVPYYLLTNLDEQRPNPKQSFNTLDSEQRWSTRGRTHP
jgi:hypothetical protein